MNTQKDFIKFASLECRLNANGLAKFTNEAEFCGSLTFHVGNMPTKAICLEDNTERSESNPGRKLLQVECNEARFDC